MLLPQDHTITVNGLTIRYWDEGAGEPVVMLHGIGASAEYWCKNILPLSEQYRVIAVDFPGFGKSDKPDANYSLDYFASFLADFLQAMGLEKTNLFAHSLGGAVALQHTVRHRQTVNKLMLANNVGFATQVIIFFRLMGLPFFRKLLTNLSKPMFAKALRTNVYDEAVITDELVDLLYPLTHNPGSRRAMRYITKHNTSFFGMKKSVLNPLMSQYHLLDDLPILVVWGKQDKLLPTKHHVPAISALLPHARVELLDQCRHIPQLEHPERFNELARGFLQEKNAIIIR